MRIATLLVTHMFLIVLAPLLASGQDLTVAAASDLQFAMREIAGRFQKQTGTQVKLIFGASGTFYQQVQNGAPFDLFFSANLEYPKKLDEAGLAESGSYLIYAKGRLVIWVRNASELDPTRGVKVLLDPSIQKIAIANPAHAPYGKAAVAAMRQEAVYDKVQAKLVFGENVSQAASFVLSGSADVGVIPLSLALSPNMKSAGRYAEIPGGEYKAIEQACIILKSSKQTKLARQFELFLRSPESAEIWRSYGFDAPGQ